MHAEKNYTTQLQAGLGMIPETIDLLRLWQPGWQPSRLADRAVEEGLFSRTTARRARNLTAEMFAPRYLKDGGVVASRIKYLIEHHFPGDALIQIFFLQTARAQEIFRDFVIEVYWPKYVAGANTLSRHDAERFIERALDAGRMERRWSESTIKRLSGYLIGCCVDFGLLSEARLKDKPIKRFAVRKEVALYLAYDLHFSSRSDLNVIQHRDWQLFGLEAVDVMRLMKTLSNDGHLWIQSTPELVQMSWKYHTMEDCLRVLVKK